MSVFWVYVYGVGVDARGPGRCWGSGWLFFLERRKWPAVVGVRHDVADGTVARIGAHSQRAQSVFSAGSGRALSLNAGGLTTRRISGQC